MSRRPVTVVHMGDIQMGRARRAEKRAALEQIELEIGRRFPDPRSGDVLVLAGDLFDDGHVGEVAHAEDRNLMVEFIRETAPRFKHVCVVYGNHDQWSPATGEGDLDVLERVADNVHVYARPHIEPLLLGGTDAVVVAAMPYPRRGALGAAIAESGRDLHATGTEAMESILRGFAGDLDRWEPKGWPALYVGHHNVAGLVTDSGQPLIGREIEVPVEPLLELAADYYALGHIHRAQPLPGQPALPHAPVGERGGMAGSIATCNYGEGADKGFAVVTLQPAAEGGWRTEVEWVPLEARRLVTLPGVWANGGFWWGEHETPDLTEALRAAGVTADAGNVGVKLRYEVAVADVPAAREARAAVARGLRLAELVWDPVVVAQQSERQHAAAVVAARTVAEQIAVVWAAEGEAAPAEARRARVLGKLAEVDR